MQGGCEVIQGKYKVKHDTCKVNVLQMQGKHTVIATRVQGECKVNAR